LKVFFFTKYERSGASSRYRVYQHLNSIQTYGFSTTVSPLFDNQYIDIKYFRKSTVGFLYFVRAIVRRLYSVFTVPSSSLVFIEYELFPYAPSWAERLLLWRRCTLIFDYDDAVFHRYDAHHSFFIRRLFGRKIADLMRFAKVVIVGNSYLAEYAHRSGAQRVVIIPTAVDLTRYTLRARSIPSSVFTVGWIGSPSTAPYLKIVASALSEVCLAGLIRIRLIGSGHVDLPGVPLEIIDWREETEVEEICHFDVGIMPLPNDSWARGKCGLKLIQYMACGLPVVASPIGVNTQIVDHGHNGYLASTTREWVSALLSLRVNAELRYRMGVAGRCRVEEMYCLAVTSPKVVEVIGQCWTDVLSGPNRKNGA
jgi:glycosyltransferase involved in cell wall biosynthesis